MSRYLDVATAGTMARAVVLLFAMSARGDLDASCDVEGLHTDSTERNLNRPLPDRILAAYANWGQCDDKLIQAAENGVNVLIWFSINLGASADGTKPEITGPATGPSFFDCVGEKTRTMRERGLDVLHLVSIGGWNSPHPETRFTSAEWYKEWHRWNTIEAARPDLGWHGFGESIFPLHASRFKHDHRSLRGAVTQDTHPQDTQDLPKLSDPILPALYIALEITLPASLLLLAGFDWDIEGNDDGAHHGNMFSLEALDLMGALSILAKQEGYTVAMAPAQSYLDSGTTNFSRQVHFPPREPWHQEFFYSGRNAYAYILARYGVQTFDFISIQLCECCSFFNSWMYLAFG